MSWIRSSTQKPLRVTVIIDPERDRDIYDALLALRFGQMSAFVRDALRLRIGGGADLGPVRPTPAPGPAASTGPGTAPVGSPTPPSAPEPPPSIPPEEMEALRSLAELFS